MFSLSNIPSTSRIWATYSEIAGTSMLIRTITNELWRYIPVQLQRKICDVVEGLLGNFCSSRLTLIIGEFNGYTQNEMFKASEIYLRTKITPSVQRLRVCNTLGEKNILISVDEGQCITDIFEGMELKWKLIVVKHDSKKDYQDKHFELSFYKNYYQKVVDSYLPYVLERSKAMKEENKRPLLYSLGISGSGNWESVHLNHPATFCRLAMDSEIKKELLEDLDRFVKRKTFYKRVGKAWKRGYLLYGPPGTGKSSLIAAMANHLNFNIFDLELASIRSNQFLRKVLGCTTNRSILVIEDIDCASKVHDRSQLEEDSDEDEPSGKHMGGTSKRESQLTLSGILNFIDGLWSSCGDERIIVFTTNHKDKLDPALLRPGRMDMHIHMSYITPCGFKTLALNYLQINDHFLFKEIDALIQQVNVTPAEVAEELMKSDDAETSLQGLIKFLNRKKREQVESNVKPGEEDHQECKERKIKNKKG